MRHEPGARLGSDPEELHQLRVAVRRIEAALGLFKHQLPAGLLQVCKGAKSVLRTLGAARDFDVQLAELDRYCSTLSQTERTAAEPLRSRLEAGRTRARSRMIRALDSEATRHWLEALSLESAVFTAVNGRGATKAATIMPGRMRSRFRKLRKAVKNLRAKAGREDYHLVRRRAKQLRYAIECGASMFGKPSQEMLKVLRRLQDRLGEHQDAHLAQSRLAALAADATSALPPETLFLMGRLAEHHLNVTAQARKTLARCWRKVRGKRWKALRAKMEELSASVAPRASRKVTMPNTDVAPAQTSPPPADDIERAQPAPPRPLRH